MATPTTQAKAPKANEAAKEAPKPEANGTPTPTTPPVEPTKPVANKKPVQQIVWPTAEAALEEAKKRTYGPRKAYTVSIGGKTVHCVAYNDEYAAYQAFVAAGGVIDELGGTTRAKKAPSEQSILQAAQSMSPEALAKLKAELAKL